MRCCQGSTPRSYRTISVCHPAIGRSHSRSPDSIRSRVPRRRATGCSPSARCSVGRRRKRRFASAFRNTSPGLAAGPPRAALYGLVCHDPNGASGPCSDTSSKESMHIFASAPRPRRLPGDGQCARFLVVSAEAIAVAGAIREVLQREPVLPMHHNPDHDPNVVPAAVGKVVDPPVVVITAARPRLLLVLPDGQAQGAGLILEVAGERTCGGRSLWRDRVSPGTYRRPSAACRPCREG